MLESVPRGSAAEVLTFQRGDLRQGLGVGGRVEEGSWDAGREEGAARTDGPVNAAHSRHTSLSF